MSGKSSKEIFEGIGVDMGSRDMQVLKALVDVASRNPEGVTFSELFSHLNDMGVKLSKVWIYKCLSRLENEGFINTERIGNPRRYITSQDIIANALDRKLTSRVDDLKSDRERVSAYLESVKSTSVEDLTMMVYDTIVGSVPIDASTVIEGVENVRSALIREFFQKAKPTDTIRMLAPIQVVDRGDETSGVTEMELLTTAAEGTKLQAILIPTEDASRDPSVLAKYTGGLKDLLKKVIGTGNLEIRSPRA
jgi:Fe2+ or Zn2+ uptake regulation protein